MMAYFLDQEIDFDDPSTVTSRSVADVEAAIPKDWLTSPARSGFGKRYADPNHPGDQIRIMSGNPADPDPIKRSPYVRISKSGKVSDPIPLDGNPTLHRGTP
jgi:hypothetical protein